MALLFGLFGLKVAGMYIVSGLVIAMLAGWVIGKFKAEGLLVDSWLCAS